MVNGSVRALRRSAGIVAAVCLALGVVPGGIAAGQPVHPAERKSRTGKLFITGSGVDVDFEVRLP
ncbi:hypothetical protein [Saccharothrix sp. HUAS TT1]|uniref:hypothetical protein n=1 Tax=unclassified Saccharothrix TaxID=2593673 RepID=UPI00345C3579